MTYQAVRGYLRDYRGAEYERDVVDPLDTAAEALQKLRGRLVSVAETKLSRLRSTSRLALGEFRVMVDIRTLCTECHSQCGVSELRTEGDCDDARN